MPWHWHITIKIKVYQHFTIFYFYIWIFVIFFSFAFSCSARRFKTHLLFVQNFIFFVFELCVHADTSRGQDLHLFIHKKEIDIVWKSQSICTLILIEQFESNAIAYGAKRVWQMWLNTVLLNATYVYCNLFFSTFYDAFYLNEINLFLFFFLSFLSFRFR